MEEDIRGKVVERTYNNIRYALYVPEEVNENTPVFTYVHGSGGTADWRKASQYLNTNGSSSIVIMPTMSWSNDWGSETMDLVNSLKNQYGITTKNVSGSGFSMGGAEGYTIVLENIKQNPDIEPQIVYFIDDYSRKTYYNHKTTLNDEEATNLFKENETIFFIYEPNSKNPTATKAFGESDLNVIRVICKEGEHVTINNNFFKNGIYDYMAGGTLPEEGYIYQRYNKETKTWENINYSDIATKEALYNYYNIDTFTTRLKSLSTLNDITIESDDKILESYLNEIRNVIRNTNFLQGDFSKQTYASTTKVPANINEIINNYFQITSSLLSKIANETTQFAKIASSYQSLDFNLSKEVDEIPSDTLTENLSSINVKPSSTLVSQLAGVQTGSIISQMTTSSSSQNINKTPQKETINNQSANDNSSSNSQQKPSQSQTKPHQNSNQTNNQQEEPSKNVETSPLEEFPKYEEIYSDDSKIVYNCDDEYKIIIHKDGEKIIGIEHYYDFKTKEQATSAIQTLTQEYSNNENFDKIIQKDQYIKILFKEESYQNMTITQIKEEFLDLEEVIKGGTTDV